MGNSERPKNGLTVACVLRFGGTYKPVHVQRLQAGVRRHSPQARFVCLSDVDVPGVEVRSLWVPWRGWWAKMALFEPGQFDAPVLYLDLDTLVQGPLEELAGYTGPFAMISDFYRPEKAQSGVLAWTPGPVSLAVWKAWTHNPNRHMRSARGDGEWLNAHFAGDVDRLNDMFPGRIVSYKVHGKRGAPAGASVVCAHGKPKPWDPAAGWLFQAWTEQGAGGTP